MTPMCEIKGCGKTGPWLVILWLSPGGTPTSGHRCEKHAHTIPLGHKALIVRTTYDTTYPHRQEEQ